MQKKVNAVVVMVIALSALVMSACGAKKDAADDQKSGDTPVTVEKVGMSDVATVLSYGADLMPSAKVRLLSLITDTIVSYPWQEGDEIAKDQVVAVIKKEGLNQGLAQIDAQTAALDVQIANLGSELGRARDLFGKGVATQQAVDQVTAQYDAAVAQRAALVAGKKQLAVTAGHAVVRAPVDGVLSGKAYEEGDIAMPQLPLGTLLVTDPLKMELKLIEKDIALVKPGQKVDLTLDAYPGRAFSGTVTRVFPYVDAGTRTNTIEVTLPNPRGEDGVRLLKPGMYGVASLIVSVRKDVPVASESALLIDNKLLAIQKDGQNLRKAFVVDENNVAHERTVVLGARQGNSWEVVEGLTPGETIVLRGQHGLTDGTRVRTVGDEAVEEKVVQAAPEAAASETATK